MGAFTNYGNNLMLQSVFNGSGTFYLGLVTALPDQNATSATLVEPSGGGYSRIAISAGSAYWKYGQSSASNAYSAVFNTASADWGRIVGWALCDALTGGNVIACGELVQTLVVQSGSSVTLPKESLVLRLL